ncbi:hypothetical protein E6O75_ATG02735 [Venturia nashicola]|uniref:Uncharacterized protein n=1 Tax=Venturia nashicola TaxID=86259 RepID=A0A4Z1PLK9_9PEZI|nr:hypothetical protein E6O75_ATG02735 [Venturia nashicola]
MFDGFGSVHGAIQAIVGDGLDAVCHTGWTGWTGCCVPYWMYWMYWMPLDVLAGTGCTGCHWMYWED